MVFGWRRAFCTSISRDGESKLPKEKQQEPSNNNTNPTSKLGSKFGFFSNPSTPRLPVPSPSLRCRTVTTAIVPTRLFLKSSLHLYKSRCGICSQSVKTCQGTAIFTAKCSQSFHFPCIVTHINKFNSRLSNSSSSPFERLFNACLIWSNGLQKTNH